MIYKGALMAAATTTLANGFHMNESISQQKIGLLIIVIYFVIGICWLKRDIRYDKASRKAHPTSLYPDIFFEEVFPLCEEAEQSKISELQREIEALQYTKALSKPKDKVCTISGAVRHIEQMYEGSLKSYLDKFQDLQEKEHVIIRLENKIKIGYKTIEKEKEAFLEDNGEEAVSFIFNRKNQLTDVILTGIMIPLLLEILKWEVTGIEDFIVSLVEKPIMFTAFNCFVLIFLYRIYKYHKNKRSMLRGMKQRVFYDKAELMLYTFECALKNVESECREKRVSDNLKGARMERKGR